MAKRLSRVAFMTLWAGVLYLIATNIQSGWLYVVIAFFFLFIIISVVYPRRMLRGVEVELSMPALLERDRAASARLTVRNTCERMKYLVRVECGGGEYAFEPKGVLFVTVPPNGEVHAPVMVKCSRRGNIAAGSMKLMCAAPASIFQAERIVSVNAYSAVYPRFNAVRADEAAREFNLHDPGEAEKLYAASDPYHYNLREYVPGDSLRNIHWKQTARVGEPVVRVHEKKIYGRAGILVDNRRSMYSAGETGVEEFEARLEEALAAAHALLFASRYTVTISGTAAAAITVEGEASWEQALHWFAAIELSDLIAHNVHEYSTGTEDISMYFGPEK